MPAKQRQICTSETAAPIQNRQGAMLTGNIPEFAMPIRFLVSVALLFGAFACASPQAADIGTTPKVEARSLLDFKLPSGKHYSVPTTRDATVLQNAKPRKIKIIGEMKDTAVVLVDTYPSIPGGMSYCQAGEERFLRVISLRNQKPVETFHLKLESCRDNIELASPGLEWSAESSKLAIHWLQGPTTLGKPETRTLIINPEGKVQ